MANNNEKSGMSRRDIEDFRALQEEMLNLSRDYSRARQAAWADETRRLHDTWNGFSQEWQGNLDQMAALAGSKFGEVAAQGEASANLLAQNWQKNLTNISGAVEDWGAHFSQTLQNVAMAWTGAMGSQGSGGGGWSALLGSVVDFGGWFHQGGIVEAQRGMVVSPETLMGDEQLIMAQAGEGVLPRESMSRLGDKNFEALRSGNFDLTSGKAAPRFDVTIQVQTLDAAGVTGLDWDRLVQRHLLPALRQEADRRW